MWSFWLKDRLKPLELLLPEVVKTNPTLIFIFARGELLYLYAILLERNKCLQVSCCCPCSEGFCPWSQTTAVHKWMWHPAQLKGKKPASAEWEEAPEDVVWVAGSMLASAHKQVCCLGRVSCPQAAHARLLPLSLSFVPTVSVCLLCHTNCVLPAS